MKLANQILRCWPADGWRDCHVLVAVSGGADSVAMLQALTEICRQNPGNGELVVGHFNHCLRGDDSDREEAWVGQLAARLGLQSVFGHAERPGETTNEDAARTARYDFLLTQAERIGARFVATAHTADDQVETVLMRILRGSGIDGLAGIPTARPLSPSVTLVRPLLEARRSEIEAYLRAANQDFCTDDTNFESRFTRNWIRHELLPAVRTRMAGDPDGALLRLSQQAGEWRDAIEHLAAEMAGNAVRVAPGTTSPQLTIDCGNLGGEPPILLQQACRHAWKQAGWPQQAMRMPDWQRLAAAVAEPMSAPFTLPGGIEVRREGSLLVLATLRAP